MTRKTRRRLRIVVLLLAVSVLSACMFLPDYPRLYKSGKYDPVEDVQVARPNATPNTPRAGTQTEPHTCGWHAMNAMYTAYGLDGEAFHLRFRLGTDEPAMRADKESTGTLHPDLYRVLVQDGFAIDALDLDKAFASTALKNHLAWKQLALAVVYRSTYHWVLLGPADRADEVVVYDSLRAEPETMLIETMLGDVLSITLIEPNAGEPISTSDAHAWGLAEMARLYQRKE